MFVAAFRRHTRPGISFGEFIEGWQAEQGYGVTNRVLNAVNVEDEHDIVTLGFVQVPLRLLRFMLAKGRKTDMHDTDRHDRVAELLTSTELRSQFVVRGEVAIEDGHPYRIDRKARRNPDGMRSMLSFKRVKQAEDLPDGPPLISLIASTRGHLDVTDAAGIVAQLLGLEESIRLLHLEEVDAPDSHLLATGADDNTIAIREVDSGRLIRELRGHRSQLVGLAFTPDGRTLASSAADRTLRLWHTATWRALGTIDDEHLHGFLRFDAAGKRLLVVPWRDEAFLIPRETVR